MFLKFRFSFFPFWSDTIANKKSLSPPIFSVGYADYLVARLNEQFSSTYGTFLSQPFD